MNDWITDKKTESEESREVYKRYIDVLFFSPRFSVTYSISSWRRQTDRQTDIRHRYYKKHQFQHKYQSPTSLLFKSNNKTLFSQNAHSMVALLVAIAVVFVSNFFPQSSLTLTLTYPPPLPSHSHTYIQTNFTYWLPLSLSFSLLSDCSGQCSNGFTALKGTRTTSGFLGIGILKMVERVGFLMVGIRVWGKVTLEGGMKEGRGGGGGFGKGHILWVVIATLN